MTRSSKSRAQRASRRGAANNYSHASNDDEREQAARREEQGRSRHRRRSSGKYKDEAAAAVNRAPNRGRGAEDLAANDVLGAFYNMLQQGAPPQQEGGEHDGTSERERGSIHIDMRKASNVLEAAAGNLALASNLYWDDYFATQAAHQLEAALEAPADPPSELNARKPDLNPKDDQSLDRKPAAKVAAHGGVHQPFHFEQHQDVDMGGSDYNDNEMVANAHHDSSRSSPDSKKRPIDLAADYPTPSKRRVRRSLDSDFQAADDDDETKKKKRAAKRARKSNKYIDKSKTANDDQDNNDEADIDEDEDDQKMPSIRRNVNEKDADSEREVRPEPRRRSNRSYVIRQQDIVQSDDDDDEDNNKEAKGNSAGSDENEEQEDGDNSKERVRRRERRQRRRGEPRRVSAQVGVETSISVSDDELGKGGYYKDSKGGERRKSTSRRSSDDDQHRDPFRNMKEDSASIKTENYDASRSDIMKAVNAIHRKINPNTTHLSKTPTWFPSPEQRRKKRSRDNDDDSVDSFTEDYICDDDWLGSKTESTPMECLWGPSIDQDQSSSPELLGGGDNINNEESNGNVVIDDDAINVSGEEEEGDDNNEPSLKSGAAEGPSFTGIPHTWLNSGFQMSECGSGLFIKSPNVDDIEFFSWRQQQVNDKRNAVPPPQHCKALTAITSIVTGLFYTGASIQGGEVNFTSGKTPWSSLTIDQRKREFESRLSDALSSLIFVAAQVSLKRKKKAYRDAIRIYKPTNVENNYSGLLREAIAERKSALAEIGSDDDENNADSNSSGKENDILCGSSNTKNVSAMVEDKMSKHVDRPFKKKIMPTSQEKKELMRRRLDLIPTCIWVDKKAVVAPRAGDGPLFNSKIRVKTSWTNIRDIKLYVKSNLRAFTEKGGIALFLETLVRIHGKDVIARQLHRCAAVSASASVSGRLGEEKETQKDAHIISETGNIEDGICKTKLTAGLPSLIRCTCEDRQKKINEENPMPLNVRIDPSKLLDTTPSGTECVSVELVTLILTGRVSSDWKDCSSEKLGIGLLTENNGEVSHGLARPEQPVWLLKGETCYTVLTIDGAWGCSGNCGRSRSDSANGSSHGDDLKTISKVDKTGSSLNICHWNGWYGQRNKTGMRLVTSKSSQEVPSKKLLAQFSEQHGRTKMRRRRYEDVINAISAEEHKYNEMKDIPIRPLELERIKIHLDDQKLYPRNHKMWRFDLGKNNDSIAPAIDQKPSTQNWIPYFQLTSRQKRMVETKLGPEINTILWTRWPEAIIDNFTPSEGGFPVV